jgi:ribosomal protein S18 acetylase RimI-like enzyme
MSEAAPAFVIREARVDERGGLLTLWREADALESSTDDPASIEAAISHPTSGVFVAESRGEVIGSVIAGWDGWRGGIYRLAVLPEWRRRGIATELVRRAEAHLRERGAVRIAAIVMTGETNAEAFWASVGYEHLEGARRYVRTFRRSSPPG